MHIQLHLGLEPQVSRPPKRLYKEAFPPSSFPIIRQKPAINHHLTCCIQQCDLNKPTIQQCDLNQVALRGPSQPENTYKQGKKPSPQEVILTKQQSDLNQPDPEIEPRKKATTPVYFHTITVVVSHIKTGFLCTLNTSGSVYTIKPSKTSAQGAQTAKSIINIWDKVTPQKSQGIRNPLLPSHASPLFPI